MDTPTLEYLLNPDILTSKLAHMSEDEALQTLKTLLTVLQMEKAKMPHPSSATIPPTPHASPHASPHPHLDSPVGSPLPADSSEGGAGILPPSPGVSESLALSTRKQLLLQRMVLQITAQLDWRLGLLDRELPLALQQQLMDTLVTAASVQSIIAQLRLENVESSLSGLNTRSGLFALTFFFRWTIRSLAVLRLPSPTGAKALIYASPFRHLKLPNMSTVVGADPNINDILFNIAKVALRSLQYLLGVTPAFDSIPSPSSFWLEKGGLTCTDADWSPRPNVNWTSAILYDLALHYVNNEEYTQSHHKLQLLMKIPDHQLSPDVDLNIYQGLKLAVGQREFEPPPFDADNHEAMTTMMRAVRQQKRPFFWHSHIERAASYYQHGQARDMIQYNAHIRIRDSCPPNYDTLAISNEDYEASHPEKATADSRKDEIFATFNDLDSCHSLLFSSEKPNFSSSHVYEPRSKRAKLKKRVLLANLFRATKPEKLSKLVNDTNKVQPVLRATTRWSVDSVNPQEILATLNRGGKDTNVDFVLLSKVNQLLNINQTVEARALLKLVEDKNSKGLAGALRNIQFQVLSAELCHFFVEKKLAPNDLVSKCRETLTNLRLLFTDIQTHHLDNCLVTLINREDWEFIMTLEEPRWLMLQITQLLITITNMARNGTTNLSLQRQSDLKRSCQTLAELICPLLQSSGKRGRGAEIVVGKQSEKQILVNYLVKIHHPEILNIVASILITLYKYSNDDTTLKVAHGFPTLPLSAVGIQTIGLSPDQFVNLVQQLAERAHPHDLIQWTRLQGELQFSVGSYASALPYYLESLIVQTHFCQKAPPSLSMDHDDQTLPHMVKCLRELGCHSFAVALCQCMHDVDYCLAFKSLEERQSNDAMDGLYSKMWDTTILEYAVSMHTKRGEQSRKKSALEKIASLEVNTNNNMEILREVALNRRSQLVRCLCLKFL
ncbi:hypothetical protein TCAL_01659 [Tigriopus californicus]|uniref:INTS8 TPR repeats domain-containing protein n=1 Tax=Tigriopus californicus TaxID=6832 RepID=A0A553PCA8_TIGCA|nr:uncharacterized protein LOC131892845 [Tigriopus californicus]TRY75313.1 hypothetical protein TCAL_01659 [Tigriopus californicus]|eukprot:TCALIF_01659-PA protein Name:"Similar to INTS8 Integrator complex subunit 8 (Homo sapiens)" AED:0.18 eAED:0.22 QI:0/-1/0/1/-1/1/1/0/950